MPRDVIMRDVVRRDMMKRAGFVLIPHPLSLLPRRRRRRYAAGI